MSTYPLAGLLHIDRKTELFLLAFFSCSGAVLGVTVAYTSGPYFFSLMRMAAFTHVSIVSLVSVMLFPFLITAISLYLSKPYLFFPVSYFKSFSYTFVMSCIFIEFSRAGWLVGSMLLVSDTVAIAALYWYWIRHIHGFRGSAIRDFTCCIAVTVAASLIDYIWISPFLAALLKD